MAVAIRNMDTVMRSPKPRGASTVAITVKTTFRACTTDSQA